MSTNTITYVNLHGLKVPTINLGTEDKPKIVIAHLLLAEQMGLGKPAMTVRIKASPKLNTCVRMIQTQITDQQSTQTRKIATLPYRKFEVLINGIDTARIGMNSSMTTKERKTLVQNIVNLQNEIAEVVESYYHDGVAINEKVNTDAGRNKITKHVTTKYSAEQFVALTRELRKKDKITRAVVRQSMELAEKAVDDVEKKADKDKRTSFANRYDQIIDLLEEGRAYYEAEEYVDAHACFMDLLDLSSDAMKSSHSYRGNAISNLRKDVNVLTARINDMEIRMDARIERMSNEMQEREERAIEREKRTDARMDVLIDLVRKQQDHIGRM